MVRYAQDGTTYSEPPLEVWREGWNRDVGRDDATLLTGAYDDAPYEDPYGAPDPPDLGRLTLVVMMDDQVVDVVRRPVRGTGYEYAARELGRGAPPKPVFVPPPRPEMPPRHEQELSWLARLVGGAAALEALDDEPLPDEELDTAGLPAELAERVRAISQQADVVSERLFGGGELRTACRRLLGRAVAAEPRLLRDPARDEVLPAAVVWAVAKANDLVGTGRQMPVSAIHALCGLKAAPTERGRALAHAVAGPAVTMSGEWRCADPSSVLPLGSPDLLVSSFRRHLVRLRDLAQEERLRAAAPGPPSLEADGQPAAPAMERSRPSR